jgi:hypothetical protein
MQVMTELQADFNEGHARWCASYAEGGSGNLPGVPPEHPTLLVEVPLYPKGTSTLWGREQSWQLEVPFGPRVRHMARPSKAFIRAACIS